MASANVVAESKLLHRVHLCLSISLDSLSVHFQEVLFIKPVHREAKLYLGERAERAIFISFVCEEQGVSVQGKCLRHLGALPPNPLCRWQAIHAIQTGWGFGGHGPQAPQASYGIKIIK